MSRRRCRAGWQCLLEPSEAIDPVVALHRHQLMVYCFLVALISLLLL